MTKISIDVIGEISINGIKEEYKRSYDFYEFNKDGSLSKKDFNYQFAKENNLIQQVEIKYLDSQIEGIKNLGGVKNEPLKLGDVKENKDLEPYILEQLKELEGSKNQAQIFENIKLAIQKVQRANLKRGA